MLWFGKEVQTTDCEIDSLLFTNKEFLSKAREINITCFVLQNHHAVFAGVVHVVHDKLRDDLGWLQNLLQRGQTQNGLQTAGGREQRFAKNEGKQVLSIAIKKLWRSQNARRTI